MAINLSKLAEDLRYIAVEGKLSPSDSRAAYVTQVFPDGKRRPIASFFSYAEAKRWAKTKNKELNL